MMAQPHMPTRSATVNDDAGGTVIIETFEFQTREKRTLIFKRAPGGWELCVRLPNERVLTHVPITYTQANVMGFLLRAARGDDE